MDNMIDIRVFYEKKGRIKFISHLDVNRLMQRALKRSKLPVWFTQGFNPHLYLTFALPLSLGYESEYEIMDLRITEELEDEVIKERLGAVLPQGITITKVAHGGDKVNKIASADFEIKIYSENPDELENNLNEFLGKGEIIVQKKTKKGFKDIDIKSELLSSDLTRRSDCVQWDTSLPAGNKNINPGLFTDEFQRTYPNIIRKLDFTKKAVRCENGTLFE